MSASEAEVRHTGKVKWFDGTKGYGFITPDKPIPGHSKPDIFVHINESSGGRTPLEGTRVNFSVGHSKGRAHAADVQQG